MRDQCGGSGVGEGEPQAPPELGQWWQRKTDLGNSLVTKVKRADH